MSQTMLLTKPLSTFLAANTTPQLHTLFILSPTGKLLSSSSPSPASTLRTQATLACSLWSLYHPFSTSASPLVTASLPNSSAQPSHNDLNSITVQLEYGMMCVRALKSGLLFVAIGPSPNPIPQQHISSQHTSPPSSPNALERDQSHLTLPGDFSAAVSEAGTERSVTGVSIWGVRRQVEDVGRFLEVALGGLGLSISDR